jgi:hypothetical protein
VTRDVFLEKIAQNVLQNCPICTPAHILSNLILELRDQSSKKSPKRQKFAQSRINDIVLKKISPKDCRTYSDLSCLCPKNYNHTIIPILRISPIFCQNCNFSSKIVSFFRQKSKNRQKNPIVLATLLESSKQIPRCVVCAQRYLWKTQKTLTRVELESSNKFLL